MGPKPKRNRNLDYEVFNLPITSLGGLPVIWDLAESLSFEELLDKNLKVKSARAETVNIDGHGDYFNFHRRGV